MPDLQTSPGIDGVDWRKLGRDPAPPEKPVDLLGHHGRLHAAGQRSYSAYLAIASLLLVVLTVYAVGQLLSSLGGVGRALGH